MGADDVELLRLLARLREEMDDSQGLIRRTQANNRARHRGLDVLNEARARLGLGRAGPGPADRREEMRLLNVRLKEQIADSRKLIAMADDHGRAQRSKARDAKAGARGQLGRILTAWPHLAGLAAPSDALGHKNALTLVLDAARALFVGCSSVSATSARQLGGDQPGYRTAASTGEAHALDEVQYRLHEGPTIDAMQLDSVGLVTAHDLSCAPDAATWPRLSEAAAALDVRSVLSIALPWSAFRSGLQAERRAVGAITLYAAAPHALDRPEIDLIMFGSWAGSTLTGAAPAEVYLRGR